MQPGIKVAPSFISEDRAEGPDQAIQEEAVDPVILVPHRLLEEEVDLYEVVLRRLQFFL